MMPEGLEGLEPQIFVSVVRDLAIEDLGVVWRLRLVSKRIKDLVDPLASYRDLARYLNLRLEWQFVRGTYPDLSFETFLEEGPMYAGHARKDFEITAEGLLTKYVSQIIPKGERGQLRVHRQALLEKCRVVDPSGSGRVVINLRDERHTLEPDEDGYVWLGLLPVSLLVFSDLYIESESGADLRFWYFTHVHDVCLDDLASFRVAEYPMTLGIGGREALVSTGIVGWVERDPSLVRSTPGLLPAILGRIFPAWTPSDPESYPRQRERKFANKKLVGRKGDV